MIHTYLDESLKPYFFCPGCGHGVITDHLNAALVTLQLDPKKVVIVTDIGCSGLTDKYFTTNAFHGLHGRSVTYATGIKLANPDLKVIVLMGDGGCGIGGHHLINAARRNIGVTVIVFNNFNYGMTGGEHSVTTPPGGLTSSTPLGTLEQPMDICQTVAVNGATFVARTTVFDKSIPDLLVKAIQHDGFGLVDIWELCTAYYVPNNRFNKSALDRTLAELNFKTGILHQAERPEYSRAYRESVASEKGKTPMPVRGMSAKYSSVLERRLECVIAGAAGKKINSAASLFCRGAVLAGLYATQRNDYPVTVKYGHSVSEVILSPQEIGYTGIVQPQIMIVLFKEGLARVKAQLAAMSEQDSLIIHKDLLPVETRAQVLALDFSQLGRGASKKESWTVMALAAALAKLEIYPLEAFKEAVGARSEFAAENLSAIEAGVSLLDQGQSTP
jgi:pyruvate/2-oxoacid:ferredoxin oxidoreductase beta subunit/Pyruvate/2-oxoacid:ferredoxin oxidoreductase gamma subunit